MKRAFALGFILGLLTLPVGWLVSALTSDWYGHSDPDWGT